MFKLKQEVSLIQNVAKIHKLGKSYVYYGNSFPSVISMRTLTNNNMKFTIIKQRAACFSNINN
jgi:hypothetical protein